MGAPLSILSLPVSLENDRPPLQLVTMRVKYCKCVNNFVAGLNAYPRDLLPTLGVLFFSTVVSHFIKS